MCTMRRWGTRLRFVNTFDKQVDYLDRTAIFLVTEYENRRRMGVAQSRLWLCLSFLYLPFCPFCPCLLDRENLVLVVAAVDSTLNVAFVVVAVHLDLSYLFLYLYSSSFLCQRLSFEDHVGKRIHCRESTNRA